LIIRFDDLLIGTGLIVDDLFIDELENRFGGSDRGKDVVSRTLIKCIRAHAGQHSLMHE
jgi:hypothetical protein